MTSELEISNNDRVDLLEKVMFENFEEVDCPLVHTFLDGVYVREIFIKAGTMVTSKVHLTRHPYSVIEGEVIVSINGKVQLIKAPYEGITEPNTRRVLYVTKDCRWLTYHLNPNNESVEQIEDRIIEKHENILLNKVLAQYV